MGTVLLREPSPCTYLSYLSNLSNLGCFKTQTRPDYIVGALRFYLLLLPAAWTELCPFGQFCLAGGADRLRWHEAPAGLGVKLPPLDLAGELHGDGVGGHGNGRSHRQIDTRWLVPGVTNSGAPALCQVEADGHVRCLTYGRGDLSAALVADSHDDSRPDGLHGCTRVHAWAEGRGARLGALPLRHDDGSIKLATVECAHGLGRCLVELRAAGFAHLCAHHLATVPRKDDEANLIENDFGNGFDVALFAPARPVGLTDDEARQLAGVLRLDGALLVELALQ